MDPGPIPRADILSPLTLFEDCCAKDIVARCKKAGLVMTPAGATYPYGKDPHDSNIRIAPTYPPLSDLITAMELFALCVKLVSVEKLLKGFEQ